MQSSGALQIWFKRPAPVVGYATAILLSALAQLARLPLHPQTLIPYITFVPFVVIAGAIGGGGPGILATILCSLESIYFATEPIGSLYARDPQAYLGVGALALTGLLSSFVFAQLKSEGERLAAANSELEALHAESRKKEEEIAAAHRQSISILERVSDGFNAFDRDGRYVYVNKAAAAMLHRTPEELLGRILWEAWPHAADSPFGAAYRRAEESQLPLEVENYYPEPLNAWFEVSCYPSPDGMSLFFSDITERKRAEQELRESQERLALVIKATGLGTFEWFPQTGRLIWSEHARTNLGLLPDSPASYETFLNCVHPSDRDRVNEIVQNVLDPTRGGHYSTEYRTLGPDGIERWISAWGSAFFDEAGRPERFLGVTLDITARKRLEEQFRQAQKLESVGRLAGGVAHDFNNLLTVIMGYTQMLLSDLPPDDPSRESLDEVAHAAARAEELTRQLLAFSRRQVSEPKNIVLNDTLQNFEKMLGRLLGEDIAVKMSLAAESSVICADPGQIEQVVMNLAVNARDAMPNGGRLAIETSVILADEQFAEAHVDIQPGLYAVLSVSDTGIGMTPEVMAHVFEPFFTTKEQGKGTGLGLSTVYGIVRQAGGAIWLYSEPGHGTTFKIFFPVVQGPVDGVLAHQAEALPAADATILLAEDEPAVRLYTQRILERQGYRVITAENGRAALDLAHRHQGPIDLLLADIIMPVMGGMELSRQFGSVRPGVPILCMSGYTDQLSPQPPQLIQKPFTAGLLLSRIHEMLRV